MEPIKTQKIEKNFVDNIIVGFLQYFDKHRFSQKDKIIFFKELSYLLKGGISIIDATIILQESTDNFALKDMANTIFSQLKKGMTLSYAIGRLPDYFDEGDVAIIKTGEASGTLPTVLASLAAEYEYTSEIKNKYVGAMIYPVILLIIAIVAVISLFSLVLPSIFSIADSFQNLELPWATQVLRNLSTFLSANRQTIARTAGGITTLGGIFFSTEKGKKIWFSLLLQIPLLGKMTQYYYVVKFCRYMKLMISSGMSYIQTFQLLKDVLGIVAYQEMLENVIANLQKGKDIYSSLKNETELLPTDVAAMIKVGEQTANLEQSLTNVLSMYDSELSSLINRLSKIIEPVMLIGIGGIVVVIAYAVFGLILQIMEGVGS